MVTMYFSKARKMAAFNKSVQCLLNINAPLRRCLLICNKRTLKTTQDKKETIVVKDFGGPPKTVEDFAKPNLEKNWVSYGFDYVSKEDDRSIARKVMFTTITLCLVGTTFIFAYMPDFQNQDWAVREAYLELYRRERDSLPLIDKNFIDPAKITLPSDEELGDMEIII